MFIRLLIFFIIGFLVYRAAKSWLGNTGNYSDRMSRPSPGEVDDVMIQDPVCGTYFPQRNAVRLNSGKNDLCFCSTECRDRYIEQQQ